MSQSQHHELAYWRATKDFTVRALAKEAKVATHTITRIEAGEPFELITLGRLAKALGIDVLEMTEWHTAKANRVKASRPKKLAVALAAAS